jgi:hypothetical protein
MQAKIFRSIAFEPETDPPVLPRPQGVERLLFG